MLKRVLILLIAGSWLLAACQGAAAPEQGEAFATSKPTGSQSPAGTNAPDNERDSASGPAEQAQCTVVSRAPTPGPTQESLFPPVSEADWVKGPDTAQVTIVEYSDFQ